ncbi:uncharacterized protein LOC116257203 isoform X3 [Nymphaea colorata]|uniref:uncharacterized protein LOC116257203 isoform X3 n=1 Tax=Nymphaea colorata TaxID=210225 RepID=UPI00214E7885|nr:uncharacterized protein LOC116257203 isoform X3 [Nymphaea colorata]
MRAWSLLSASPFHPHAANPLRLSSPSSCSLQCSVPTVPANARTRKPPRRGVVLASTATPSRTQRIMETISLAGQGAGGAGGSYSYDALKRLDKLWLSICSSKPENFKPSEVVKRLDGSFWYSNDEKEISDKFDVLVCGGTLGVFIATALSLRGLKVGIVERDMVKGREQEWNISEKELRELVEAGILLENDIEQVTVAKFNPNRCGFEGKGDIWVEDILNLGVSPAKLIEVVKQRFINSGGTIYEGSSISTISVYDDSVKLGDPVLHPFLQDVVQFWPLARTLGTIVLSQPQILPSIFKQPNLSPSWLFQKAMSAQSDANVSPDFINELLYVNFQSMKVSTFPDRISVSFLAELVKPFSQFAFC